MSKTNKLPSVSIREAARKSGTSHVAIIKAIGQGRLDKCVDRSGKNNRIWYDIFLKEAEAIDFKLKGEQSEFSDISSLTDEEKKSIEALTVDTASLKESRRREAYYKSELARLEFEEKDGTLQNKVDTYNQQFEFGRRFRDMLLSLPDRITDQLMSMDNRDEVYNLLYNSIRDIMEELLKETDKMYDQPAHKEQN
ncbi:hypothetical protein [Dysgonomonas sp.]